MTFLLLYSEQGFMSNKMISSSVVKQTAIFTLGWTAYASTYLLRKPLGVVSKIHPPKTTPQ